MRYYSALDRFRYWAQKFVDLCFWIKRKYKKTQFYTSLIIFVFLFQGTNRKIKANKAPRNFL